MKKKLLYLLVAFALVLSACSNKPATSENENSDEIIIGSLAPLTGNVAIYGISTSNGIKLAVEEINEAGGILGKKVRLITEDEKGDTQEAMNAYNKLLEAGAQVIIGDVTSGPSVAVAELANRDGILMITPTGTQLDITEGKANVFRAAFTDPFQGQILAKYVVENLGAKTVGILSNTSSDYSQGVKETFIEEAENLNLEIVSDESYGASDKDFRVQLTTIARQNPDVLLIPDYYETIALIAPQAREVGLDSLFVGPDGWDGIIAQLTTGLQGEGLVAEALEPVEGAVFTNHYSLDDQSEKIQNFISSYRDLYGEDPSSFSALGYDATYMVKQALEEAGTTESQASVEAMKALNYEGITGSIKFDENNNPIKAVSMIVVRDGQYKLDTVVQP